MTHKRRWILTGVRTAAVISLTVGVSGLLWAGLPDANRLTSAAARGDVTSVRLYLWLGVDPNTPSRWGWNQENEGQTPLTAAAQFGRVDVVRLLLDKGADANLRDFGPVFSHETPLSTAAMHGQLEVCRVLLAAGADPNVPTNPMQPSDPGKWTALDWALQAEQSAIVDLLRLHGAVEGRRRAGGG